MHKQTSEYNQENKNIRKQVKQFEEYSQLFFDKKQASKELAELEKIENELNLKF